MKALVMVALTGCASLGYHFVPRTHTYSYDRAVAVDVRSEPEGATIVDDTGKVLGTAPMTVTTHHRVERKRRSKNVAAGLLGCVFDLAGSAYGFYEWGTNVLETVPGEPFDTYKVHVFDTTRQRVMLVGAAMLFADCFFIAATPVVLAAKERKERKSLQVMEVPFRGGPIRETAIPRPVTLEARWADWAPAKVVATLPTTRTVTLRRGHAGTFDDAIVRRARTGVALGPEGSYRAGVAFLAMARETKRAEHATIARTHFERYLASDGVSDDRRAEVTRALAELRTLGAP